MAAVPNSPSPLQEGRKQGQKEVHKLPSTSLQTTVRQFFSGTLRQKETPWSPCHLLKVAGPEMCRGLSSELQRGTLCPQWLLQTPWWHRRALPAPEPIVWPRAWACGLAQPRHATGVHSSQSPGRPFPKTWGWTVLRKSQGTSSRQTTRS